jgi:AAA+ ATPase superfamily predicted ATPase
MSKFVGRQPELKILSDFTKKKSASFIVIRGRRRIGKSRLIEEFGKSFSSFYSFIGLAPNQHSTKESQLAEFSRQIAQQL